MFNNNNRGSDDSKSTPASTAGALNTLVKGTVLEGNIRCENDLRVDGTIKGKLNCQAKIIIGPSGVVDGEVSCQNAVIEGRFKGNLRVTDLLNVRETAEVEGEITTNKLLVQSGARFNVACRMETGNAVSNGASKHMDGKTPVNATAEAADKIVGGKAEVRN